MTEFREKYINPFTDYGFKRLFGEEPNKDLLLDFLNELLRSEQGTITELTYLKNENLSTTELNRKAVFDLYCTNTTFPIRDQAVIGSDWDFELKKVYTIAILDFIFDEDKHEPDKFRYDVKLSDIETRKVFYDKLTFIYLEMPKFNKSAEELESKYEKWLFILKNLHKLDRIPDKLKEGIFVKLFETAEIAKFSQEEYQNYEDSLKYYRDIKNSLDTAREEGMQKGMQKVAIEMIKDNEPIEKIIKFTGLSKQEIETLKKE